jgi:hypothetical protein
MFSFDARVWCALRRVHLLGTGSTGSKSLSGFALLTQLESDLRLQYRSFRSDKASIHAYEETYAQVKEIGHNRIALVMQQQWRNVSVAAQSSLNVVGLSAWGAVLFTLRGLQPGQRGGFCAALPGEVIRMQSREHFRVRGLEPLAELLLPGRADVLPVHALSEQGFELRLDSPTLDEGQTFQAGALRLDGLELRLPHPSIVHSGPASANCWRVGARFHGLAASESRALRRWIDRVPARFAANHSAYSHSKQHRND